MCFGHMHTGSNPVSVLHNLPTYYVSLYPSAGIGRQDELKLRWF